VVGLLALDGHNSAIHDGTSYASRGAHLETIIKGKRIGIRVLTGCEVEEGIAFAMPRVPKGVRIMGIVRNSAVSYHLYRLDTIILEDEGSDSLILIRANQTETDGRLLAGDFALTPLTDLSSLVN
jgi:hypothetical protein